MKKVIKKVLIVILAIYAILATIAASEFRIEAEDAVAKYNSLNEMYLEIQEQPSDDLTALLPYKLFYDAYVQDLRGNAFDWENEIEEVVEEYNLSEIEQWTLTQNVEWLITLVSGS